MVKSQRLFTAGATPMFSRAAFFLCALLFSTQSYGERLIVKVDGRDTTLYENSYALIVAQSQYENPQWNDLPSVEKEASDLKVELERQGFSVKIASNLGKSELFRELEDFFGSASAKDSRLILYYMGHGWTDRTTATGYLVPSDTPSENTNNTFKSRLFSMRQILAMAEETEARHAMFVFDSCFSGALFTSRSTPRNEGRLSFSDMSRPVRSFLTAGREDERVPAISTFTPAFIAGIQGEADTNQDEKVTGNELGAWLKDLIAAQGRQTPQYGTVLGPSYSRGEIIFVPGQQSGRSDNVPPLDVSIADVDGSEDGMVDAAVWGGTKIIYYRKASDSLRVLDQLEQLDLPVETRLAQRPEKFKTNTIACGPDIDGQTLRKVASAMKRAGVVLKSVRPFRNAQAKRQTIEVLTTTLADNGFGESEYPGREITDAQLNALSSCPDRAIENPIRRF